MSMRKYANRLISKYLESQARRVLTKYRPRIVAVGGSVGKTSTKLAIATVLSQKYQVLAQVGSYNTEIGMPLAILKLELPGQLYNPFGWLWLFLRAGLAYRSDYPWQIIVLELGTDRPGDMAKLLSYIKPDVGVITAVTVEHMAGFGSIKAVLDEEFELARASRRVLLNGDDVLLSQKRRQLDKIIRSFGLDKGDYLFKVGLHGLDGIVGELSLAGRQITIRTNLIARHGLYALTAAAGVADLFDLNQEQIISGLEEFRPLPGRMNPLAGLNDSMIIDDSYNSSPDAAIAALETLYTLPAKRRLAVLGSMNELGSYSKEGHESVGEWCAKLDRLIIIGAEAKRYLLPRALKSGLAAKKAKAFSSPYAAGSYLAKQVKPGDLILVKGSQNGIFAEEAVKKLLANPADSGKLARQTGFWQKRKAAQFKLK